MANGHGWRNGYRGWLQTNRDISKDTIAKAVCSQRPIQEPELTLEKFRKSYQKYKWPFFPFNEATTDPILEGISSSHLASSVIQEDTKDDDSSDSSSSSSSTASSSAAEELDFGDAEELIVARLCLQRVILQGVRLHLHRAFSLTDRGQNLLLDADSGLRPPNVLEAQAADKALWQMIHDLVLDQQFTLDNAIHEDLQKDVANQKAKANKEAKRAKHLLAQPGSQKQQCKANGNSYVCSSNRASVKKEIPAVSAICAPIHWRRDKHAANLIVRLTISSNHTDSYRTISCGSLRFLRPQ
ncbi:unnamed protein product [Cladocopium goreaui]|uniref:Uncharacterized protein n=1 Tax=Cladocopium goreaui TaxID=2562237 RepID=A0A9P1DA72_9DINO|nr:unnamed protein product [Cladocopium goreaui]